MRRVLFIVALCACEKPAPLVHFLDAPADATATDCDTCNPLFQSGCNAREKCTLLRLPPRNSCDIACRFEGPLTDGAACDPTDDRCLGGLVCVDSHCRAFCNPHEKDCSRGLCSTGPNGFLDISICSPTCDPEQPVCAVGTECFLPVDANVESPGCLAPGSLGLGNACTLPNDCASGLTCVAEVPQEQGLPTCRRRCVVANDTCPAPTTCHPRIGPEGYGICR